MAANFTVTASNLSTGAEQLENLNSQFKQLVEQLTETEASLNSMWEGEARTQFNKVFNEDKIQMDNFSNLITKYAQSLNTIASNYAEAEQTNVSIASTRTSH